MLKVAVREEYHDKVTCIITDTRGASLTRGGGGLTLAGICHAPHDMGRAISRQHLCFIGLACAFALADLLGTALFRSFAILGRNAVRIDQFLGEGRFNEAKRPGKNQE
jgi:hypothetical protein